MQDVKIGGIPIGEGHPCFIVAEIGINHNGDLDYRKNDSSIVAFAAGCNAVKFQKTDHGHCVLSRGAGQAPGKPFRLTNGDLKGGLEFGEERI